MPKYASMGYVLESMSKDSTLIEGEDIRIQGSSHGLTPQILYNKDAVFVTLSRFVSVYNEQKDGSRLINITKKPLDYAIAIEDPEKLRLVQREIEKTQRAIFKKSRESASKDILRILGINDESYRKLIDCNPMLT